MSKNLPKVFCLFVCVLLANCTSMPSALPATAVVVTATLTPTSTLPAATPTPLPTATPTPVPTPNPAALLASADDGFLRVSTQLGPAERLLCLRYEDTDADGEPEWLALVYQDVEPARLSAFVLDQGKVYPLEPAYPNPGKPDVGLGQYATCDVRVRDINADGKPEIAIFGHAAENETQLTLFVWAEDGYRRLGVFSGDADVRLVDVDGDLEEEIWEGYRIQGAPEFTWYVIHTWENDTYGWTSDHYDWYYLERPHSYPTHKPEYSVISFYLALNDRDLPGAYNLLQSRDDREYATWALGYATTARVSVGDAHLIPDASGENSARVAAMVTAWDNEGGVIIARLWNTEWDTVRTAEGWRLVGASYVLLEEWPVEYWP